jgi:photosystem II stability/assembly factor-like uncharacterized protein
MTLQKYISNALTILTVLCVLLFFASFGFKDSKSSGWYQQWFPTMNGNTINSITFLDSLIGYAVTSTNSDTLAYILKTTNGGDNWSVIYTYVPPSPSSGFTKIQFANSNIGYASTNYYDVFKTTNSGSNWIQITTPWGGDDMAVINTDSVLLADYDPVMGGIYRTTDGGDNWQRIWTTGGSGNPSKIYMYDKNMGFACQPVVGESQFRKTTNGGFNWFTISDTNFLDIKFSDTLTGYKVFGGRGAMKTTDGGITWIKQIHPSVYYYTALSISVINKDTVWFAGPAVIKNSLFYGVLCKTTNGGTNWGYQIPDTSIKIDEYFFISFANRNNGWAYQLTTGVHTKVGGNDTTYYTGINNQLTKISPKNFELNQNYPNPYNNTTLIEYYLNETGWVKLKIFDIAGREMATLVNEVQSTGGYGIPVSVQLSSGVYFYKLIYTNKKGELQMDTKKMMIVK